MRWEGRGEMGGGRREEGVRWEEGGEERGEMGGERRGEG